MVGISSGAMVETGSFGRGGHEDRKKVIGISGIDFYGPGMVLASHTYPSTYPILTLIL